MMLKVRSAYRDGLLCESGTKIVEMMQFNG